MVGTYPHFAKGRVFCEAAAITRGASKIAACRANRRKCECFFSKIQPNCLTWTDKKAIAIHRVQNQVMALFWSEMDVGKEKRLEYLQSEKLGGDTTEPR